MDLPVIMHKPFDEDNVNDVSGMYDVLKNDVSIYGVVWYFNVVVFMYKI